MTRFLRACFAVCLLVGGPLIIVAASFAISWSMDLPNINTVIQQLQQAEVPLASEVYDRHGVKIGEFAGERRYEVDVAEVPRHVIQAFLAAEDRNFFSHPGIDVLAIVRSLWVNIRGGGIKQGASTITQQVARGFFLTSERTIERKVKEIFLALALERSLSKQQILHLYLNKIFLGHHSYGIESASRNYFRKSVRSISVGEAAILAALPKAPTRYAPQRNPQLARERQLWVLGRMHANGYISPGTFEKWQKQGVKVFKSPKTFDDHAPYFLDAVRYELTRRFPSGQLPQRGLKIYTTLDSRAQLVGKKHLASAVTAARRGVPPQFRERGEVQGALLSLDPATGAVRAMQGGMRWSETQFNRTRYTRRAIAQLTMPFLAAAALDRGFNLLSPVDFDPMGSRGRSEVTLLSAMQRGHIEALSPMIVNLGLGTIAENLRKSGFPQARATPGSILGGMAANPIEVAAAFGALVNEGRRIEPYLINRIVGPNGERFYRRQRDHGRSIVTAQSAFIVTHAMKRAIRYDALKSSGLTSDMAGIGAVTPNLQNSWFAGVRPGMATVVWIGAERGKLRLAEREGSALAIARAAWIRAAREMMPDNQRISSIAPPPSGVSFTRSPGKGKRYGTLPFRVGTLGAGM